MLSSSWEDPPKHVVPRSVVKPSELGGAAAVTGVQAVHPPAEPAAFALNAAAGAKGYVGSGGNPSQHAASPLEHVVLGCDSARSAVFVPRAAAGGKGSGGSAGPAVKQGVVAAIGAQATFPYAVKPSEHGGAAAVAGVQEAPRSVGKALVRTVATATATVAQAVSRCSTGTAAEQGGVAAAVLGVQVLPPSAGKPSAVDPVLVFGNWLGVDQSRLGLCAPMAEACPVGLNNNSFS